MTKAQWKYETASDLSFSLRVLNVGSEYRIKKLQESYLLNSSSVLSSQIAYSIYAICVSMHNCTLQHIYNSPLLRSVSVVWLIFLFVHHQLLAAETWAAAIQRLSADCSFWCRWHQWQMIPSGRHLLQIFSIQVHLPTIQLGFVRVDLFQVRLLQLFMKVLIGILGQLS